MNNRTLGFVLLSLSSLLLCTPAVVNAQWEPDRRLTFNDSSSYTSDNNAWCVAASGDTVHVVWFDYRISRSNSEIFYLRSLDGGVHWDSEVRLTYADTASTYPSIAVLDDFVYVVWSDYRNGIGNIYYKRSTDGGTSWEPDLRLSTTSSYNPCLAAEGSSIHVTWADSRNGRTIYYRRSTDRGLTWEPEVCISSTPGAWEPAVAASGGKVNAVWVDNTFFRIYLARSPDGGASWLTDTCLVYDSSGQRLCPTIAAFDSFVHIAWSDSRGGGDPHYTLIYYKRSTDGGASWGADTRLSGWPMASDPSLAVSGSNVHLVWHEVWTEGYLFGLYLCSTDNGASWPGGCVLTYDYTPQYSIAVSGSKIHLVWDDRRDGNNEIYYKRNPTGNSGVEVNTVSSPVSRYPFSVRPNPFTSFATLTGHEGDHFALYDISGRRVGTYKGDRIGEGLATGVYFLRSSDQTGKPLRVVKVR